MDLPMTRISVLLFVLSLCALFCHAPLQADDVAVPAPPAIVTAVPPVYLVNTTPIVALQPIAELIGATVKYKVGDRLCVVTGNGHSITFTFYNKSVTVDGKPYILSA